MHPRAEASGFDLIEGMALTSKDRAALRGEAHHLNPLVHVGHEGVTSAIRQSLDDALRTKELVKVAFNKTADIELKKEAATIAASVEAEVVQVIGRTMTLYRRNPELKPKGDLPPWRR
jgi:RNA-binding protein